jgi:uncharacterized protein DUF6065/2-oxoglutarate-Fe(II)-dependent oxygenase superfamily protein
LTVRALAPPPGGKPVFDFCRSNFSHGIVTFHTDYIFRTDDEWDLLATGSFNSPKPDLYPLTGIIESSWLPYPFTMNWQVMRPGTVVFAKDEPFCLIFPIRRQAVLQCRPEIHDIEEDPELVRRHEAFKQSRLDFMKRFDASDPAALKSPWLKYYFRGRHPDGTVVDNHINKLRVAAPRDKRRQSCWKIDSPLNNITDRQTSANQLGRSRIDANGRLRCRDEARQLNAISGRADHSFLVIEDFLGDPVCDDLRKAFFDLSATVTNRDEVNHYWDSRFIWHSDVAKSYPQLANHMLQAQRSATAHIADFYRLTAPVYPDLLQIMSWSGGIHMPPHADNANPDGAAHAMAHRDFSAVIYLNDDYQGGEFYFTALNTVITPSKGMLIAFTAGFYHEHAVLRVEGGERLTMPFFLTFNKERADPTLI